MVGANILKITYGYTVEPNKHDDLVKLAGDVGEMFGIALQPGFWLVDSFPFCK